MTKMKFFTGIHRNTESQSYMTSLTEWGGEEKRRKGEEEEGMNDKGSCFANEFEAGSILRLFTAAKKV